MSRCPSILAIAVAAMALASPLAAAQVGPFTLAAEPSARTVFPGETANYTISVGNSALLKRTATMNVTSLLPVGWTYAFTPHPVEVNASSSAQTVLSVFVPDDAAPQNLTITYEASDSLGGFARSNVTLTVAARPPSPSGGGGGTGELPPPRLRLSVTTGDSGASGSTVQGALTILHDDPARSSMSVQIGVTGPWNARIHAADQNRVLDTTRPSTTIPLFVDVPALTENATANVTITAAVEGTTFTARWSVTGIAPPPAPQDDGASDATTTAASDGSGAPTTFPRSNFEILVQPLELPIEPDGTATASVKLTNTGTTELTITLTAPPPTQWRPFDLEDVVTIPPGETREVPMTLHAPPGVPTGGTAEVTVQGAADGIVRQSPLLVRTVPPSIPRDETPAATQTEAPAAPEGSGLPTLGPGALVAVGLAAAGTTAVVLASRPMREKILWGAAGLYTRLARPDVLGHEDRERLYRLVETQPGIHFHALQRDLAWNTGTLTYHIRVLEKHGFVVSRRDGLYRRFYLAGAAPRKEVFENAGPSGLRADVIEAIRSSPGISQSDLALALSANKQTVNYHVKALERAGSIRVEKRGRDTFLYPASDVPAAQDVARA